LIKMATANYAAAEAEATPPMATPLPRTTLGPSVIASTVLGGAPTRARK
jgi:hypothetical protein